MESGFPKVLVATDTGLVRDQNEDSHRAIELRDGWLVTVCDGMGGHNAGELASRIAADTIVKRIEERLSLNPSADPRDLLWNALVAANKAIIECALESPDLANMGTTAVVLLVVYSKAYVGHVGDSRVYLLRSGELLRITSDHSTVQQMVDEGLITPEQARTHPESHRLTRALGVFSVMKPSVWEEPISLRKGDTFLLCTDGVTDVVEDDELEDALLRTPQEASERMLGLVRDRGAPDNATLAIFQNSPPRRTRRTGPKGVRGITRSLRRRRSPALAMGLLVACVVCLSLAVFAFLQARKNIDEFGYPVDGMKMSSSAPAGPLDKFAAQPGDAREESSDATPAQERGVFRAALASREPTEACLILLESLPDSSESSRSPDLLPLVDLCRRFEELRAEADRVEQKIRSQLDQQ